MLNAQLKVCPRETSSVFFRRVRHKEVYGIVNAHYCN